MSHAIAARAPRAWSPAGFDDYRTFFPLTPTRVASVDREATTRFSEIWNAGAMHDATAYLRTVAPGTTIVFVRGFLGNYMPGNLVAAARAVTSLGFDAFIARNRAGGTVEENARAIGHQVDRRGTRGRLLLCGHSRGGAECLTLLAIRPDLAARCGGVVVAQMPYRRSRVLESMLGGAHRHSLRGARRRAAEASQRLALTLVGARAGGLELGSDSWERSVARIDRGSWPFPVVQCATWSIRPTAWLDSFHERLGEIAPGEAHDGQFYLDDLLWPSLTHVLLPHVDHAQPCVGGFGFDVARFWTSMLATGLSSAVHAAPHLTPTLA